MGGGLPENVPNLIEAYLQRRAALLRYFMLRTGSQERAEDIVQDVYLKIAAMDAQTAGQVLNPGGFLYRLGSNLMSDRVKQEGRSRARCAGIWGSALSRLHGR